MSNNNQQGQVVAGQASQYISIVPENGEQFVAGQKIIYNIEPEVGYIKKDSYLLFDVLNTSAQLNRVSFPHGVGAHALIDNVNIYSKETGVLLESLQNYGEWRIVEHQYLNDSLDQKALKEGVGKSAQSYLYNEGENFPRSVINSAHEIENNVLSPVSTNLSAKYASTRFCIPLKTGLMGHFDNDPKLIPILNFGGLRIEIQLATNRLALQHLGARYNRTPYTAAQAAGNSRQEHVVPIGNDEGNNIGVGLRLGIDNGGTANNQGAFAAANTCFIRNPAAHATNWKSLADCGLAVGNVVKLYKANTLEGTDRTFVANGGGGESTRTITAIAFVGGNTTINGHTGPDTIQVTLDGNLTGFTNGANDAHYLIVSSGTVSYKITKTEYRLLQIQPPPEMMNQMAQGINYEFTSYETFLDNIPTASMRHQIPVHSVASKALALFSSVYDSNLVDNINHQQYYYGLPPESSLVNNVVYFINNRLYPLRSYNPQAKEDKVLTLNELNKALQAIGKSPLSLGSADFGDLNGYSNKFLFSRELARQGFVFDLRNAEPEVRLQFSGVRASVLRVNTFVFSKRIVQTTAQGVQVIY